MLLHQFWFKLSNNVSVGVYNLCYCQVTNKETKYAKLFSGHAGLTLRSRLQCDFFKRDKEDKSLSKKSRYLVS